MTIHPRVVLRAALSLWRRDRQVLAPLSGLFVFLPQYAVLLLVPEAPRIGDRTDAAAMTAWGNALSDWFAGNGALYVGAMVLAQFGALAIIAAYLTRPVVTVGGALRRALILLLRYLLASILVSMPLGLLALLALPLPGGILLAMVPIFYILGRTSLVAPILVAERTRGAMAAVVRSWTLTRGHGVMMALLIGGLTVAGQVAGAMIVAVDHAFKTQGMANPVVIAVVDAGAAGMTWASALALALVEAILYRRFAR